MEKPQKLTDETSWKEILVNPANTVVNSDLASKGTLIFRIKAVASKPKSSEPRAGRKQNLFSTDLKERSEWVIKPYGIMVGVNCMRSRCSMVVKNTFLQDTRLIFLIF